VNLRIKWQKLKDGPDDVRIIHTDYRFPDFSTLAAAGIIPPALLQIPEEAVELHAQLAAVHGVSKASIGGYFVAISKGVVFEWEEIMPRVEQVLQNYTNAESVIRGDLVQV